MELSTGELLWKMGPSDLEPSAHCAWVMVLEAWGTWECEIQGVASWDHRGLTQPRGPSAGQALPVWSTLQCVRPQVFLSWSLVEEANPLLDLRRRVRKAIVEKAWPGLEEGFLEKVGLFSGERSHPLAVRPPIPCTNPA